MSRGDDIQLDPEEVKLVTSAAEQGQLVRVKRGLINPSFLISIIEDKSRDMRYTSGPISERRALGMTPLKDIFSAAKALPAPRQEG